MNEMFGEGNSTNEADNSGAGLPQNPDQLMAGFKKMAEAAALTIQGESTASDEEVAKYSNSIAQALKGLQEGSDNLSASLSESEVMNMFSSFNMDGVSFPKIFICIICISSCPKAFVFHLVGKGSSGREQRLFTIHGGHDAKSAIGRIAVAQY